MQTNNKKVFMYSIHFLFPPFSHGVTQNPQDENTYTQHSFFRISSHQRSLSYKYKLQITNIPFSITQQYIIEFN